MIKLNVVRFSDAYEDLAYRLHFAPEVHVGEWQSIQGNIPQADTIEVEDVSFEVPISETIKQWQQEVGPNLPWAEDHFLERVSGVPHNPPPSHEWWPFAQKSNTEHRNSNGRFSHTYPERFWPKFAGEKSLTCNFGIRYYYGDLADVVVLLKERPGTRQAYLPVFFPEDTGAVHGERIPCTLGYHFLLRNGRLKCVYYIRSCDFIRHFKDDVYMAGRLCQWIAEELRVEPGKLVMHISSLHIFSSERSRVGAEVGFAKN